MEDARVETRLVAFVTNTKGVSIIYSFGYFVEIYCKIEISIRRRDVHEVEVSLSNSVIEADKQVIVKISCLNPSFQVLNIVSIPRSKVDRKSWVLPEHHDELIAAIYEVGWIYDLVHGDRVNLWQIGSAEDNDGVGWICL